MREWLQAWTSGFIKDGVINGTLMNTNFLNFIAMVRVCSSPAGGKVSVLNGYCLWNSILEAVHWQGLSVGYGSNDTWLKTEEIVQWMVCHTDRKYLHQGLIHAIIKVFSQSDEDSYHHLYQKKLDISFFQIYQYLKLCSLPV